MPQPNMQQMLQQVQKMQEDMPRRRSSSSRGGRGLRRRRHGHRQGQRRPGRQVDHDRPRGDRPRGPRAARRTWCSPPSTRRMRAPRSWPPSAWAALTGGLDLGSLGPARACSRSVVRTARPAPDHRARQAAGHRPAHGAAARVPHPAHRTRPTPSRWPTRSARSRSGSALCEVCFNLADEPRCDICRDERRDASIDLRRRGAGRRDPDRAHARVPRPLPRARRRAVARSTASIPRT